MTLGYHQISRDLFAALASGDGGSEALRELAAAQYSKHVLLLLGVLNASKDWEPAQAARARRGYDLLTEVQHADPATARLVILHPAVGAWAQQTIRASRNQIPVPGAEPGHLSAVAAAAAIRARFPAEVEVGVTAGAVTLPTLGAVLVDGRTAIIRSDIDKAEVLSEGRTVLIPADPHTQALGWLEQRRVQIGPFDVLIDDVDPLRMPTSLNLAPRLNADEARQWDVVLHRAWKLLEAHHPSIAAEMAQAVSVIVPCAMSASHHVSFSSPETFGAIGMSCIIDPCLCAVTLTHELQHNKLFALLDIVTLTLPDNGLRYYAPWRDDPRPIDGLLQGAYAFLGVSGFWRRQRLFTQDDVGLKAHVEFARWRLAVSTVIETLMSSKRLTSAGLDFVQGMAQTVNAWQDEPVPVEAQLMARRAAALHSAKWQSNNGRFAHKDSIRDHTRT